MKNGERTIEHRKTAIWRAMSPKQQIFCEQYMLTFDAPTAARAAGYSEKVSEQAKTQVLETAKVQNGIRILTEERAQSTGIDAAKVLQELGILGFFDIRTLFDKYGNLVPIENLPEEAGHAIMSITETIDPRLNVTKTVKLHPKVAALNMIATHLGMLVDRKEISGPDGGPVEVAIPKELTVEEWEKKFG